MMNAELKASLNAESPEVRRGRIRWIVLKAMATQYNVCGATDDIVARRMWAKVLDDREVLKSYDRLCLTMHRMLESA